MRSNKILLCIASILALATGFGSAIDISSCDDLANINNDLTTGYTLTQDIDCSGSGNSIMIGTNMSPFVGSFDGDNHSHDRSLWSIEESICYDHVDENQEKYIYECRWFFSHRYWQIIPIYYCKKPHNRGAFFMEWNRIYLLFDDLLCLISYLDEVRACGIRR